MAAVGFVLFVFGMVMAPAFPEGRALRGVMVLWPVAVGFLLMIASIAVLLWENMP